MYLTRSSSRIKVRATEEASHSALLDLLEVKSATVSAAVIELTNRVLANHWPSLIRVVDSQADY
jgi:hypothetical protein